MLFHKDIRLPDNFRLPNRVVTLEYSRHAMQAATNDRYGMIPVLPLINLGECEAIEVEVTDNRVRKIVLRAELDDVNDVVLAVIPQRDRWFVKTVWINRKDDLHKTLDRSKYER